MLESLERYGAPELEFSDPAATAPTASPAGDAYTPGLGIPCLSPLPPAVSPGCRSPAALPPLQGTLGVLVLWAPVNTWGFLLGWTVSFYGNTHLRSLSARSELGDLRGEGRQCSCGRGQCPCWRACPGEHMCRFVLAFWLTRGD